MTDVHGLIRIVTSAAGGTACAAAASVDGVDLSLNGLCRFSHKHNLHDSTACKTYISTKNKYNAKSDQEESRRHQQIPPLHQSYVFIR